MTSAECPFVACCSSVPPEHGVVIHRWEGTPIQVGCLSVAHCLALSEHNEAQNRTFILYTIVSNAGLMHDSIDQPSDSIATLLVLHRG